MKSSVYEDIENWTNRQLNRELISLIRNEGLGFKVSEDIKEVKAELLRRQHRVNNG